MCCCLFQSNWHVLFPFLGLQYLKVGFQDARKVHIFIVFMQDTNSRGLSHHLLFMSSHVRVTAWRVWRDHFWPMQQGISLQTGILANGVSQQCPSTWSLLVILSSSNVICMSLPVAPQSFCKRCTPKYCFVSLGKALPLEHVLPPEH